MKIAIPPDSLLGLRILFVLPTLDLGGAERQALYLAEYLQRRAGCETAVAALFGGAGKQALRKICREKAIPCLRFNMPEFAPGPNDSPAARMPTGSSVRQFIRELTFLKPDILLPYTTLPNILCGLAWKKAGAVACIWGQRDAGNAVCNLPLHRLAIQNTPLFCSNSQAGCDHLLKNCAVALERIFLIPGGVRLAKPQKSREKWRVELGVSKTDLLAGMIGNIQPLKDHRTLIHAWKQIVQKFPERPPALCLAGECGPETAALRELADTLGISPSVRFLGPVEDISGLLAALDLAVLSSVREGLPNGILEPMAAGLAIAATDNPGSRQALGTEQHPFLAPPGDAPYLAKKMLTLLADAALRQRLGKANQKRVAEAFSVEAMGRQYERLLSQAISGHFPPETRRRNPNPPRKAVPQNSVS